MGLESVVQEEGIDSPTRPCFERNSQYYDTQIALTPYPPQPGGTNDLTRKGVRMVGCGIFLRRKQPQLTQCMKNQVFPDGVSCQYQYCQGMRLRARAVSKVCLEML